jgi:hypothetical protein
MESRLSHEDPILIVLPEGADVGAELASFVAGRPVTSYQLPEPWAFESAGIGPEVLLGSEKTLRASELPEVLRRLTANCDGDHLTRMVARAWRDAPPSVREYYLDRSALQTVASLFGIGARNAEVEAPERFWSDQKLLHYFTVQYRLASSDVPDPQAPAHEGSLAYYPFDALGKGRRPEGADLGPGVLLEGFAYAAGRQEHRAAYEAHGTARGWRVVDPREL